MAKSAVSLSVQAWARRQVRLQQCRDSLLAFVREAVTNDEGKPIDIAPLHMMWHVHLDYCWTRGLRSMILSHFGSGKSTSFAVPLVAWLIGNNPQLRIKLVCNSLENARLRVGTIKRIMESSVYREIFPSMKQGDRWSGTDFFVKREGFSPEPTVHARGIFTTGIGGRADVEIFDDVVDQKNAEDPLQRKKVKNLIDRTWLSRLEPGDRGRVGYFATPWHLDDATHQLMQQSGWCTLVQCVADDCETIQQEVIGGGPDYPQLSEADLLAMMI